MVAFDMGLHVAIVLTPLPTVICFRRTVADFNAGRIARVRDHLSRMPSFELLAKSVASETLPSYSYWSSMQPNHPEKAREILKHRPRFETIRDDTFVW